MDQLIQIESNNSLPFHAQFEARSGKVDLVLYNLKKGEDKKIELEEEARFSIPCKDKDDAVKMIKHIRWCVGKAIDALNSRAVEINAALYVAEAAPVVVAVAGAEAEVAQE